MPGEMDEGVEDGMDGVNDSGSGECGSTLSSACGLRLSVVDGDDACDDAAVVAVDADDSGTTASAALDAQSNLSPSSPPPPNLDGGQATPSPSRYAV